MDLQRKLVTNRMLRYDPLGEMETANATRLTVRRTKSGGYVFISHSQKADDFLSGSFGVLTKQDVDVILRRAERRGLMVRELTLGGAELRCGTRAEVVKPMLKLVKGGKS